MEKVKKKSFFISNQCLTIFISMTFFNRKRQIFQKIKKQG